MELWLWKLVQPARTQRGGQSEEWEAPFFAGLGELPLPLSAKGESEQRKGRDRRSEMETDLEPPASITSAAPTCVLQKRWGKPREPYSCEAVAPNKYNKCPKGAWIRR